MRMAKVGFKGLGSKAECYTHGDALEVEGGSRDGKHMNGGRKAWQPRRLVL